MKTYLLKTLLLIFISSLYFQLNAQSTYYKVDGIFIDSISNAPVDFVDIGIIGKNVGSVSNEKGNFHLIIPNQNLGNFLSISRIGYNSKNILVGEVIKQTYIKIFLIPKITEIQEIQINQKALKSKTIGNISKSKNIVFGLTSDTSNLGREVGMVMHLPKNPVFIKSFNFHISGNNTDSAKLRLNLYEFANGEIGKNLLKENIFFTITKKNSEDFNVDLSRYNIHAANDILISTENVAIYVSHGPDPNIKNDKYFYNKINISGSILGPKSFYKQVSFGQWEKIPFKFSPGFWIEIMK
jgi:hypothetical protein